MDDIVEIKNYILFLKKECNLDITLHPYGDEQLITSSELIVFNIHENAQCVYVKSFPSAQNHCIMRQKKVFDKCKTGSFCGTCFAGVFEYVYPIFNGISVTGFICVSGYRNADYTSYVKRCSEKFYIPIKTLMQTSLCLKEKVPEKVFVDTVVAPLLKMLELAYSKSVYKKTRDALIDRVIRYINRNYTKNITLDEICENFLCSRSHISHSFKQSTGQSFRKYLTSLRLKTAKSLLTHSNLGITEIAFSVGFNDSNYFSNVFKSIVGMSPRMYRNQNVKKME